MRSLSFAFVLVSIIGAQLTLGSAYASEEECRQSSASERIDCLQAQLDSQKLKVSGVQGELKAFSDGLAHAEKTIWLKRAAYGVTVALGVYLAIKGDVGVKKDDLAGLAIDIPELIAGAVMTAGGGVIVYFTEENFSRAKDKVAEKQKELNELTAEEAQEQRTIDALRAKLSQ